MNKKRPEKRNNRPASKGKSQGKPQGKGPGKRGGYGGPKGAPPKKARHPGRSYDENAPVRLNKYIANSGICSRREADVMIKTGVVSINGEIVTELGTKVKPGDVVKYDGHTIKPDKKQYVLLNKPKNFNTTHEETPDRRSVMSLIKGAVKEAVFPVDKLDRNTTGLLLFTNDDELTRRFRRKESTVSMIFHVTTKQKIKSIHLEEMRKGVNLEGVQVEPVKIDHVGNGEDLHQVGIEVKGIRAKIVADLFTHYGYQILKLDRVTISGLTKKDLPRGKFRSLTKEEVGFLYMNS